MLVHRLQPLGNSDYITAVPGDYLCNTHDYGNVLTGFIIDSAVLNVFYIHKIRIHRKGVSRNIT